MDWDKGVKDCIPWPIWFELGDRWKCDADRWRLDFIRTWPTDGQGKNKLVILDAKYYCVYWLNEGDKIMGQPGVKLTLEKNEERRE